MQRENGYTMVELMVVVAIVAILASVAAPTYINYQNRAKQTEAIEALLRAKMDQEAFWAENNRYASTIGCLFSFGNTCSLTTYLTSASTNKSYQVTLSAQGQTIWARRMIPSTGMTDTVRMALTDVNPRVLNEKAMHFSVFKYIFE